MKTYILLFISVLFCLNVVGQNTDNRTVDPLKIDKKWVFGNDTTFNRMSVSDSVPRPPLPSLRSLNTATTLDKLQEKQQQVNFKMEKITPYYDYNSNIYGFYQINEKSWVNTARENEIYYGLGGSSSASAAYNYKLTNFMTLTTGASLAKYNVYNNFYNDLSFRSNLRVALGERFAVNLFGSYSPFETLNPSIMKSLNMSAYPASNYGGSFEFKVTDKWGIMTGVEREFDAFRGKWVNRPFIMPVFYGK
jgi:hypothetical protein